VDEEDEGGETGKMGERTVKLKEKETETKAERRRKEGATAAVPQRLAVSL
jgi:hypothetical protein